jgi:hypothetical protein
MADRDAVEGFDDLDGERETTDVDRAVLLTYLSQGLYPEWAQGQLEPILAVLLDWPMERVNKAFADAEKKGYLGRAEVIVEKGNDTIH